MNIIDNYFNLEKRVLKEANKIYESLTYDFESISVESRDVGFLAAYAYPLLTQLQIYYTNDLCISTSITKSLVKYNNEKKVISFHFENSVFRVVSFWDYSMSLLNEYLQLGFHTDSISKQEALIYAGKKAVLVPGEECNRLVYIDLEEDEKIEKQKQVNKIKILNKKDMYDKYINNFSKTKRLDRYFELLNSKELIELQKIRNQIIHSRSLGTDMVVNFSHFHMKNALSSSSEGWIDFNETINLLETNLLNIKEALYNLTEIILLDDFPNYANSSNRKFYMYDVECSKCGFNDRIPEVVLNNKQTKICHSCWESELTKVSKLRTNEINHGSKLYNYIQNLCNCDINDD